MRLEGNKIIPHAFHLLQLEATGLGYQHFRMLSGFFFSISQKASSATLRSSHALLPIVSYFQSHNCVLWSLAIMDNPFPESIYLKEDSRHCQNLIKSLWVMEASSVLVQATQPKGSKEEEEEEEEWTSKIIYTLKHKLPGKTSLLTIKILGQDIQI